MSAPYFRLKPGYFYGITTFLDKPGPFVPENKFGIN
jgi:hypothetical protein